MSYLNARRHVGRLRRLADRAQNHYNGPSYFAEPEFPAVLKNSDGVVVTRGIFTLPLLAMDALNGRDRHDPSGINQPFIAGPENALLRVFFDALSSVHTPFNPITLYGPSGVGKSHLLYGSVNHLRSLAVDRKVCAVSGADFARLYARAVELDSLAELRERFLAPDVFIVDGLQELAAKRPAQQELLNAVDCALDRHSRLLFSCVSSPADWSWMLPALRSRLTSGLIVSVASPRTPTRIEMVRRLAVAFGLSLTDESMCQIASGRTGPFAAPTTFSQLRGILMQRANDPLESNILFDPLTHRRAKKQESPSNEKLTRRIARLVAQQFDLKLTDLLGSSRRHSVVRARGVAMYLARSLLSMSFEQLGREFGGRDHTTVLHAYRKVVDSLSTDHFLKQTMNKLVSQLTEPLMQA